MIKIQSNETVDDLMIDDIKVIQKNKGFRFTLDSVLLGHFASLKEGDKVADLGTGTGVIPLILTTRVKKIRILGIELQSDMAEMSNRTVLLNHLEEKIEIIQSDIREVPKKRTGESFTLVIVNPPYWSTGQGFISPEKGRALARHQIAGQLDDFIETASKLLNFQGRFAMIYRTDRILEVFDLLRQHHLEPRRVRFIHSYLNKPARHFLLEARKNAPPDLLIHPPLVVYNKPGEYSDEIMKWYGKGDV